MAESPDTLDKPRGYEAWLGVVKNYQKCQRLLAREFAELGISVAQHEVLIAIARGEGVTQQQLAERLLVVKSNVTSLLQRLESQGLVRRDTDSEDARQKRISLTERGRRLAARSFAIQREVMAAMMGNMDDRELEDMSEMSRRISRTLDRMLDGFC